MRIGEVIDRLIRQIIIHGVMEKKNMIHSQPMHVLFVPYLVPGTWW